MCDDFLADPVQAIPTVGPRRAAALQKAGVFCSVEIRKQRKPTKINVFYGNGQAETVEKLNIECERDTI